MRGAQVLSLKGIRSSLGMADFEAIAALRQLEELVLDCDQPPEPALGARNPSVHPFPICPRAVELRDLLPYGLFLQSGLAKASQTVPTACDEALACKSVAAPFACSIIVAPDLLESPPAVQWCTHACRMM
jgi:hypothetical protein